MTAQTTTTIGIVGARGHTGSELIKLVQAHPHLQLVFVSSRELGGQRVAEHNQSYEGELHYESLDAEAVAAKAADVVILALPNAKAEPFVAAIDAARPQTLLIDLSADYRFDPAWYYGLPELTRAKYTGQKRISNPGCYATAMQLTIAPLLDQLAGPPQCFGVSGYSGAGTTPSDKNNPALLADNLMPYALTNHMHEREVSAQLGVPVEFMPHVAPHFRGITMTVNLWLQQPLTREQIQARYAQRYADEPLIEIVDEAPWVSRIAGRHGVQIGGVTLAPGNKRVVVVATLDNLLKGAATQAMQNLNLAFGWDELMAIR
ncbi:N-acetyl-gamma-glutamyl-phosphate reductase [Xanthomonas nasturtii]|uniref:N-acetyl-gamma-glutamyl-phosphate reductase n=1 Tax=Xanthomonas nasturtii TaxID=1843581 RepID=A0A3E1KRW3_9XANT|nr:N-acetyl-gamma-glutamyl-phosphate reductase [Xanthomonas nasturtii]MCL1498077.1 N-acetyl-gamma-glutamyl-phosphate reductase [Xanthomonas nasturtii]MCL1501778.1 N-acetyl-gamma-glutamyl-phosphate reductase [Xanthomonas nasturtii]MCL1521388.1 N-acetyl-gamma-glutamyl-phosphate reductase [Xanthomonas nasturtii]MCL1530662.1 N-acetyl-gamma-glutamyl-phosphate reductase [Xanthomonas nasturtii]MCL1561117.1 N-acetyl-gamma-glutamyl-phosphate reductase [Xanthomonas nasturtii]